MIDWAFENILHTAASCQTLPLYLVIPIVEVQIFGDNGAMNGFRWRVCFQNYTIAWDLIQILVVQNPKESRKIVPTKQRKHS